MPFQEGSHWGACPEGKILWGSILRNKDLTFLIVFSTFKTIFQIQKALSQCLDFSLLFDEFTPVKARKRLNHVTFNRTCPGRITTLVRPCKEDIARVNYHHTVEFLSLSLKRWFSGKNPCFVAPLVPSRYPFNDYCMNSEPPCGDS